MPVAIETVIIVIVTVSFAVLSAVVFALYWLWRLLQEDRRCNRLNGSSYHPDWRYPSSVEEGQRALLGSRRGRNPRITRRQEVCVDERSRRRVKATRCAECLPTSRTATTGMQTIPVTATSVPPICSSAPRTAYIPSVHSSARQRNDISSSNTTHSAEVIVLDGTEPPPPYEAALL